MLWDDTVGIYYNMIPYSVTLHKAPKGPLHQINQTPDSQKAIPGSPSRMSYGMSVDSVVSIKETFGHVTTGSDCNYIIVTVHIFLYGWNENLNAGCCRVCWFIQPLFDTIVYSGAVVYVVHVINHPDVSIKKTNIVCCWMTLACMTLKWKWCHFVEIISGCTESCPILCEVKV